LNFSGNFAYLQCVNSAKYKQLEANSAAAILLEFREGRATDIKTLLQSFGFAWPPVTSDVPGYQHRSRSSISSQDVVWRVQELIDVGLLQADNLEYFFAGSKIRVTELLSKLQKALGLSLTFLTSFDNDRCIAVEPLFGLPKPLAEKLDVFVLMPFKEDMLPVYEDHIKPTCASMDLSVRRADDFFTAHSVVQDIWKAIVSARSIVADCTDRNPNVFYEIGLAHTIGKPTVLLTQRAEDIPFDLRHLRYIEYQLTPRGMKEFETKFKQTVQTVLSAE
jgi:hypothetical protein